MLFIKNLDEINQEDIITFCNKYSEGIRVEYKSNFDGNVRNKISKVVSSFANSYGGILILGVKTENGIPIEPYEGFEQPTREEIELTIEELCLSNIFPVLIPTVKVVGIKDSKNVFVVIEIHESSTAPHAIENSTKMYIRTGNQSKPYDLADLDRIELLLQKRSLSVKIVDGILQKYNYFHQRVHEQITNKSLPEISVKIMPLFMQGQIVDLQNLYLTSRKTEINNDNYFRVGGGINRFDSGVFSSDVNNDINEFIFNYCGIFGEIITNMSLTKIDDGKGEWYIRFLEIILIIGRQLLFAGNLYKNCNYLGDIKIDIEINNVMNQLLVFTGGWKEGRSYYSLQSQISNSINTNSLTINDELDNIISELLYNIIWAFNQGIDSVSQEEIYIFVKDVLIKNNVFIT